MNNLTTFDFGGHDTSVAIRVVTLDGEPWFVAKDICDVLQIKNVSDALKYLDDEEKQLLPYETIIAISKDLDTKRLLAVSESGMYMLVIRSRKPEAKAFRKWVTSEVLPSIRKTGKYELPQQPTSAPPQLPMILPTASELDYMRSRQWEKDELKAIAHGKKPDLKAIRQEFHEKSGLSRVDVALSKYQKLLKPSN